MPQGVCRRRQPTVATTEHAQLLRLPPGLGNNILRLATRLGSPTISSPPPPAPIPLPPLRRRQSSGIGDDARSLGGLGAREGRHFSFEGLGGDGGGFVGFFLVLFVDLGPRQRVLGEVFFDGSLAEVADDELSPDLGGLAGNLRRVSFEFFLRGGGFLLMLFRLFFFLKRDSSFSFLLSFLDLESGGRTSWMGEVILMMIGRSSW